MMLTNVSAMYLKSFGDTEGGGFEFASKKKATTASALYVWVHAQAVRLVMCGMQPDKDAHNSVVGSARRRA